MENLDLDPLLKRLLAMRHNWLRSQDCGESADVLQFAALIVLADLDQETQTPGAKNK